MNDIHDVPTIEQWLIYLNQVNMLEAYNSVSDAAMNEICISSKDSETSTTPWSTNKKEKIHLQLQKCEKTLLKLEDAVRYRMLYEYISELVAAHNACTAIEDKSIDQMHTQLKLMSKRMQLRFGLNQPSFQRMVPPELLATQAFMETDQWISVYLQMYPALHQKQDGEIDSSIDVHQHEWR